MFGKSDKEKRFIKKSEDQIGLITVFTIVDVKTGVSYLLTQSTEGLAVTALLDEAGDPVIEDV